MGGFATHKEISVSTQELANTVTVDFTYLCHTQMKYQSMTKDIMLQVNDVTTCNATGWGVRVLHILHARTLRT